MRIRILCVFLICALLLCSAGISAAQESAVKGNLGGTIFDKTGGVVLGAKVTLTSPTGVRTTESDDRGEFLFNLLIPGAYSVKVEKQGFRTLELKGIEVMTGRTNSVHLTLEAGAITEVVEVSASAIAVDTSSTSIGANLPDTFYQQIPVGRNVSGIFYLSPGVVSGGGSGISNPSISGGSGLENLYVADGVNITDSSYGGLGTFSRIYGSLGTGINLSFVKEVQIKTGGYEPQYGQATGGIVQIVTKSGGSEYHGAIAGYFFPQSFEATRLQPDDFGRKNLFGKVLHGQSYEASGELGGYIPHFRDRFFFFGSVNPTYASDFVLAPPNSGLFSHGQFHRRTNTLAYSGKLTYKLNDHHQLEASVFGDPAHTSTAPRRTLVTDNSSSFSKFEYGTRSVVGRYNGTFSSTWVFNASFSYATNEFKESGFQNIYQIVDRTQAFGLPGQRGVFTPQGLGFFEPSNARRYGATVDTSKEYRFAGKHSFSIGYHYDRPFYDDGRERSGPRFPIPATNASGTSLTALGVPASAIGVPANATFSLRIDDTVNTSTGVATARSGGCTLCPYLKVPGITGPGPNGMVHVYLRQDRGEFGPSPVQTNGTYHAAYAMDSWSPNKYLTMNFGLRWEQQTMKGTSINYTYVDNWSPRIGAVVDPWGNGRTKIYGNFGRYNYAIPLDMAIRSLSDELDFTGARWAPAFTTDSGGNRIAAINGNGTVNPALDAAHLLNRATGGIQTGFGISTQSTTGINPGTKMEYEDEYVVGFEHEFKGGVILSARYVDRRLRRIVEDMSGISPEAFNAGVNQVYLIGNVNKNTDIFVNPLEVPFSPTFSGGNITNIPSQCDPTTAVTVEDTFGNTVAPGAVCFGALGQAGLTNVLPGDAFPDGIPDGFPDPIRNYQAVEIEVNKGFSKNWQMRANWRIARLFGNFEGAFRNDNGQTDPSISSLFDFVQGNFGLLGDQFKPGHLNTDRRHVVNIYTSYVVDRSKLKGLTLGTGVRIDTGTPISQFVAHPAYLNSGEVPLNGRGSLGVLPVTGSVDIHVDYPWAIKERWKLRFGMDLFNVGNSKRLTGTDQNLDSSFGTRNTDFQKPTAFFRPFNARAMVRLEF